MTEMEDPDAVMRRVSEAVQALRFSPSDAANGSDLETFMKQALGHASTAQEAKLTDPTQLEGDK